MFLLNVGHVVGLFSFMVRIELKKNVALEEKRLETLAQNIHTLLKLCDDFDPAGTSTGGLIAIMLSRLRLNIKECNSPYTQLAEQILKRDRTELHGSVGHSQDKYPRFLTAANKHHGEAMDTEDIAEHCSDRTRMSCWNCGDCNCQDGQDHQDIVRRSRTMSAIAPNATRSERRQCGQVSLLWLQ
jgi:hypothetical protein